MMKFSLLQISLLLVFCYVYAAVEEKNQQFKKTYVIHMDRSNMPASFDDHFQWYDSSLKSVSDSAAMLYTYSNVIHGFSTRLTVEEVELLEKQPGILAVLPEAIYELHTTRTPEFLGLGSSEALFPASEAVSERLAQQSPELAYSAMLLGRHVVWLLKPVLPHTSGKPLSGSLVPLVHAANVSNTTTGNLCLNGSLIPAKVAGKIVICDRGGNARAQKGMVVKDAGGLGMILTNTDDFGEELVADAQLLPSAAVGQIAGDMIKKYLSSDPKPTATIASGVPLETASSSKGGAGVTSTVKYTRTLTNVGASATYKVSMSSETQSVKMLVEPESLSFSEPYEKKSYTVTFTASSKPSGTASFARLQWSDGKHVVSSPIAFSWT
ncbi:hypothetical protein Q3G72_034088 [Acer saccharum]|nr:hypothetical protein Q3G72_034088 [Acer saccharum]